MADLVEGVLKHNKLILIVALLRLYVFLRILHQLPKRRGLLQLALKRSAFHFFRGLRVLLYHHHREPILYLFKLLLYFWLRAAGLEAGLDVPRASRGRRLPVVVRSIRIHLLHLLILILVFLRFAARPLILGCLSSPGHACERCNFLLEHLYLFVDALGNVLDLRLFGLEVFESAL